MSNYHISLLIYQIVLMLYDTLLTFPKEVRFVWASKFRITNLFYVTIRLIAICHPIIGLYPNLAPNRKKVRTPGVSLIDSWELTRVFFLPVWLILYSLRSQCLSCFVNSSAAVYALVNAFVIILGAVMRISVAGVRHIQISYYSSN